MNLIRSSLICLLFALANVALRAQEFPTLERTPDPVLSLYDDFQCRLRAAVGSGDLAQIKSLYQTNGATPEVLTAELIRWKPLAGKDDQVSILAFKEIASLPPESHNYWTGQAHRMTEGEVTHIAMVGSKSSIQLILPMTVENGRLLIVPSEKIFGAGQKATPRNGQHPLPKAGSLL